MGEGKTIENWIEAAELAKKHNRDTFFGVAVQVPVDDGSFFVVVFDKNSNTSLVGGIPAKKEDLDRLKELGVTVED